MNVIAYLKQQCGWSRGIREVLAKCGIEYQEKQINIAEIFEEMSEKTGQTLQPCIQFDDVMLVDVSGEEVLEYLTSIGHDSMINTDVPLDAPCTEEEHQEMEKKSKSSMGGSQPHIPIRDTGFYGAR